MPEDRREKFAEFHACELYGGYGPFEGIEQEARFGAITALLSNLNLHDFKVAYGAVNLKRLHNSPFGSASPQDVAFRRCVLGTTQWLCAAALFTLSLDSHPLHQSSLRVKQRDRYLYKCQPPISPTGKMRIFAWAICESKFALIHKEIAVR